MYYLYRYFKIDGVLSIDVLTTTGYPSSEEGHYLKFNRTTVYVNGRKDNSIIVKPFNILAVPAPRPRKSITFIGEIAEPIADISLQILVNYIKSLPLTTDLSKIDITTIYPELFV